MGSVFSPHYAAARKKNPHGARAQQHLAINLALYGEHKAWVFTEQAARPHSVTDDVLHVGNNTWRTTADGVELQVCDRSVPFMRPVVGRIVLSGPKPQQHGSRVLRQEGNHHWWPMMPVCRIEVDLQEPKLRWQGHAYHDLNWGDEPLAKGFRSWSWMRSRCAAGTSIVYSAQGRDPFAASQTAPNLNLSLHVDNLGVCRDIAMPALWPLKSSRWRLRGQGNIQNAGPVQLLEDTPFYRRSQWSSCGADGPQLTLHETLDLDRFVMPWVQKLMLFRLRRIS